MREVYRDMIALHETVLEIEGRHAEGAELELFHSRDYLERVRGWAAEAERKGGPYQVRDDLVVSGATWDASRAAVGCAIVGAEIVLRGEVRSAFCAVRPPGRDAVSDAPGRFGFLNPIATAVRSLVRNAEPVPVLVVEWGTERSVGPSIEGVNDVRLASLPPVSSAAEDDADADVATRVEIVDRAAREEVAVLERAIDGFVPEIVFLSASFDGLAGDPLGKGSLHPRDYFEATSRIVELAKRACDGRIVSVLEGGYHPAALGAAAVQHLRALAGLGPAS